MADGSTRARPWKARYFGPGPDAGDPSESVLSDRLQELTAAGLISRTVNEGPPLSVTYERTASGRALIPALDALAAWAGENLPATDG